MAIITTHQKQLKGENDMDITNKEVKTNTQDLPDVDDVQVLADIYRKLPRDQKLIMYGQAVAFATMNNASAPEVPA